MQEAATGWSLPCSQAPKATPHHISTYDAELWLAAWLAGWWRCSNGPGVQPYVINPTLCPLEGSVHAAGTSLSGAAVHRRSAQPSINLNLDLQSQIPR